MKYDELISRASEISTDEFWKHFDENTFLEPVFFVNFDRDDCTRFFGKDCPYWEMRLLYSADDLDIEGDLDEQIFLHVNGDLRVQGSMEFYLEAPSVITLTGSLHAKSLAIEASSVVLDVGEHTWLDLGLLLVASSEVVSLEVSAPVAIIVRPDHSVFIDLCDTCVGIDPDNTESFTGGKTYTGSDCAKILRQELTSFSDGDLYLETYAIRDAFRAGKSLLRPSNLGVVANERRA